MEYNKDYEFTWTELEYFELALLDMRKLADS